MRDQFKSDNPGMTFGQLSKYTSHMYKSLTPEEKSQWDIRAHEDKTRYDYEMISYIPPPGHDATGKLIEERPPVKKQKKVKDPNAPKRARGSYVFYTFEMRPIIMAENPETKFVELGSIMGERWRALTPDEKRKYEDFANEDKVRFSRELGAYTMIKAQEAELAAAAEISHMAHMPVQQQQQQQHYEPQAYHQPVEIIHANAPIENSSNDAKAEYHEYSPISQTYLDPNQAYYDPTQYHYT